MSASPGLRRSERLYRALLRVYPPAFRSTYGTDAAELFRDRYREAEARSGFTGVCALWLRTVPDVLLHGLLERAARWRRRGGAPSTWAYALRSALRSPTQTAFVVVTLGVGIGANVALFSVIRGVLIRPLPFPEPERLVQLWEFNPEVAAEPQAPSPWNFADWERSVVGFDAMAAWYLTSGTYRTDAWVEEIRSAQVTADFFRVLGVRPMLGRDFRPEEVTRYGPVMLSHRVWQRRFGGDPAVVGSTIISSARPYEIVGVMPPDFTFPDETVETWVAWDLPAVYADRPDARTWRFLQAIGRVSAGTSVGQAEEALGSVAAALAEAHPDANQGWGVRVTSLHDEVVGDVRATLWVAFAAVLSVLLIACANVANLLLARVPERAHELAIRASLGADRKRLMSGLLAEHFLLAVAGGVFGLILGAALLEALVAVDAGRIPRLQDVRIDLWVLAFTLGAAGLTSVVFGLAPAVQALRGSAASSLKDGARSVGRGTRLRESFVAAQVAVAVALLAAAGLFRASFERVRAVDPGFESEGVVTFRVSLDPVEGSPGETVRYYDGLQERIASLPGVERVGATQALPISRVGNDFRRPYRPAGSATEPGDAPAVQMRIVTEGYVEALRMRLLDGDAISRAAALGEPLVALVNRTLAERLWPGRSSVGETIEIDFREGWQPYTVLGVVEDVRHYGPRTEAGPEVYLSHRQVPYLAMTFAVRTSVEPESMVEPLREAVMTHTPMQPAHAFVTLAALRSDSVAEERFLLVLLSVFSAVALMLATGGVYGVIAYTVGHRRREIGVRMALGAREAGVVRDIVGRALLLCGGGLLAGLLAVWAGSGVLEGLLYGVAPSDPATLVTASVALLSVAAVAAWVPARRAGRVAPADALRME